MVKAVGGQEVKVEKGVQGQGRDTKVVEGAKRSAMQAEAKVGAGVSK